MKTCARCKVEKPLFNFSPDKRTTSGAQSRCKVCFAEVMRAKRAENPEAHRESIKRSVKRHYAKKLERNAKYRKENPEKVALWKKKDRQENKARVSADNAKRRSLLHGEVSIEIKQLYVLRDFYRAMSLGEDFHVDHIVPVSKNGLHVYENLQIIPAIDNLRKGANI